MINKEELLQKIPELLNEVKSKNPLTHCITNFVTVNDCANAVLAIGASPIMSEDIEEVAEVVSIADALVINIGKLSHEQVEAMKISSAQANKINTPVILDPVGVGISQLRNKVTLEIIENYKLAAIRGNITEIKTIAKLTGIISESNTAKGVDVSESDIITQDNLNENADVISKLAAKLDTVILASGPIDILSDGETTIAIDNGDEMMPYITGSGCMLSSADGVHVGQSDMPAKTARSMIGEDKILGVSAANIKEAKKKLRGTAQITLVLVQFIRQIQKTMQHQYLKKS